MSRSHNTTKRRTCNRIVDGVDSEEQDRQFAGERYGNNRGMWAELKVRERRGARAKNNREARREARDY